MTDLVNSCFVKSAQENTLLCVVLFSAQCLGQAMECTWKCLILTLSRALFPLLTALWTSLSNTHVNRVPLQRHKKHSQRCNYKSWETWEKKKQTEYFSTR